MPLAYIALGANLPSPAGLPDATLAAAVERLGALGGLTARSSLYSTTPVGLAGQPRFLNAVVALETSFSPLELLGALLTIEREFGRDRSAAISNGPRTLDLDMVVYGDFVLNETALEIPHPRFRQRAFVLVPLAQIAPNLRDPRFGSIVTQLLQALPALPASSVVLIQSPLWPDDCCHPAPGH